MTAWTRSGMNLTAAPQVKANDPGFERLHPRGANGRFIKIGGRVRISALAGGGEGTVRGIGNGDTIDVERDNGTRQGIRKGYLTVLDDAAVPGAAAPAATGVPNKDAERLAEAGVPTLAVPPLSSIDQVMLGEAPPAAPEPPAVPAAPGVGGLGAVEVDGATFHPAIAGARGGSKGAFLSLYEVAEYDQMRPFLAHDGTVGGALKDHGDGRVEIVSLFNHGGPRGSGLQMFDHLVSEGGNYAEAYGDDLRALYESKGFEVTESYPFDRDLAAADWDYDRHGTPNYYLLRKAPDERGDNAAGAGAAGERERPGVPGEAPGVVRGDTEPGQPGDAAERVGVPVLPARDSAPVAGVFTAGDRVTIAEDDGGGAGVVETVGDDGIVWVRKDNGRLWDLSPKALTHEGGTPAAAEPEPPPSPHGALGVLGDDAGAMAETLEEYSFSVGEFLGKMGMTADGPAIAAWIADTDPDNLQLPFSGMVGRHDKAELDAAVRGYMADNPDLLATAPTEQVAARRAAKEAAAREAANAEYDKRIADRARVAAQAQAANEAEAEQRRATWDEQAAQIRDAQLADIADAGGKAGEPGTAEALLRAGLPEFGEFRPWHISQDAAGMRASAAAKHEVVGRLAGEMAAVPDEVLLTAADLGKLAQLRADTGITVRRVRPDGNLPVFVADGTVPPGPQHYETAHLSGDQEIPAGWEPVTPTQARDEMRYTAINDMVQLWAINSGGLNARSLAMQQVAGEVFAGPDATNVNDWSHVLEQYPEVRAEMAGHITERGEAMAAFLRAQHQLTQRWFAEQGITHVRVFRGQRHWNRDPLPDWAQGTDTTPGLAGVPLRPLSSFSSDEGIAREFAFGGDKDDTALLFEGLVPVSKILSSPRTGVGALEEAELVVLAHDTQWMVRQLDQAQRREAKGLLTKTREPAGPPPSEDIWRQMVNEDWTKTSWDGPTDREGLARVLGVPTERLAVELSRIPALGHLAAALGAPPAGSGRTPPPVTPAYPGQAAPGDGGGTVPSDTTTDGKTLVWSRAGLRLEIKAVPWKEEVHPRDSKGRFIETGAIVAILGGGTGTVRGYLGDGWFAVDTGDGRAQSLHRRYLTVTARPGGGAPTASRADAPKAPAKPPATMPVAPPAPDNDPSRPPTPTGPVGREVNPEPPRELTEEEIDSAVIVIGEPPETAAWAVQDAAATAAGNPDPAGGAEPMRIVETPTTYTIPAEDLDGAAKIIDKANKRAERAGIPQRITYALDKRWMAKLDYDATGRPIAVPRYVEMAQITLNVPSLQHDGWTFVGTMSWEGEEKKNLITRLAPGAALATRPQARHCDVCNAHRDRNETYVVQNPETGEEKQVGSNCLEQFMGIKPGGLWMLGWEPDFKLGGDEDDEAPGPRGETHASVTDALALTIALVEANNGYFVTRTQERDEPDRYLATASIVQDVLFGTGRMLGEDRAEILSAMNDPATIAKATELRDFAATLEGDSEYVLNLRSAATADYISYKNTALLVSAYAAQQRGKEREAAKAVTADSKHLGEVGGKLPPTDARVTSVRYIDGVYDTTTLLTMVTPDGNVVKWFASGHKPTQIGDEVTVGGTIKKHGEFRGVAETELTRAWVIHRSREDGSEVPDPIGRPPKEALAPAPAAATGTAAGQPDVDPRKAQAAKLADEARIAAGLDERWKTTKAGFAMPASKLRPGDWIYTVGDSEFPELFRAGGGQRPGYANVRRTVEGTQPHPSRPKELMVRFTDGTSAEASPRMSVYSAGDNFNPRDIDRRMPSRPEPEPDRAPQPPPAPPEPVPAPEPAGPPEPARPPEPTPEPAVPEPAPELVPAISGTTEPPEVPAGPPTVGSRVRNTITGLEGTVTGTTPDGKLKVKRDIDRRTVASNPGALEVLETPSTEPAPGPAATTPPEPEAPPIDPSQIPAAFRITAIESAAGDRVAFDNDGRLVTGIVTGVTGQNGNTILTIDGVPFTIGDNTPGWQLPHDTDIPEPQGTPAAPTDLKPGDLFSYDAPYGETITGTVLSVEMRQGGGATITTLAPDTGQKRKIAMLFDAQVSVLRPAGDDAEREIERATRAAERASAAALMSHVDEQAVRTAVAEIQRITTITTTGIPIADAVELFARRGRAWQRAAEQNRNNAGFAAAMFLPDDATEEHSTAVLDVLTELQNAAMDRAVQSLISAPDALAAGRILHALGDPRAPSSGPPRIREASALAVALRGLAPDIPLPPETPSGKTAGPAGTVAAARAALPDDMARFGQRRVQRTTIAPTLEDLQAGRIPESVTVQAWVPDRADDGGPGANTMAQLAAVTEAGRALSDAIDARLGERAFDHEARISRAQEDVDRAMADLAEAERQIAGSSYDFGPGTDPVEPARRAVGRAQTQMAAITATVNTERREATLAALAEVRPMGMTTHARLPLIKSPLTTRELKRAMEWAQQHYPTAWLEKAAEGMPLTVQLGHRGGYSPVSGKMILSSHPGESWRVPGAGNHGRVAVHEIGHHFENTVAGLLAVQDAYLWSRTTDAGTEVGSRTRTGVNDLAVMAGGGTSSPERGRADTFPSWYSGREYEGLDGYELFTTAAESLFAGSTYLDEDMRQWALGVLAVL